MKILTTIEELRNHNLSGEYLERFDDPQYVSSQVEGETIMLDSNDQVAIDLMKRIAPQQDN